MFNWFNRKRYFVEFEATDFVGINWSQVKIIRAKSEADARAKFDWWAFKQQFECYTVLDVKEDSNGRQDD
jgi:hypothetical protein